MKKILVSIILLFPLLIKAQILEVSGIQEGIWDSDTILIVDNVVVPEGKSLIVTEGTRVIFDDYFSMTINGSFKAIGCENDSIYLTSRDTTGFFNWQTGKGGWNGLVIQSVKDTVLFDYCHFSFGKAIKANSQQSTANYGGALRIYNSCINVNNSTFYHNLTNSKGGALYAEHSSVNISNCEVDSNFGFNEEGVYMHGAGFQFNNCKVKMENMYFHDNYCTGCYGGGVNFDSCYVNVNNAIFEDNYAINAAGMGIQRSNDFDVRVSNCLFDNNIAYHYGGAMAMATSSPLIQNVTMTNNYTISAGGGAMQFYSKAHPVFKNCIIWGNDWYDEHASIPDGSQIFVWGSDCSPEFYNSILQGGYKEVHGKECIAIYDTTTMIDGDPLFVDIQHRDFDLQVGSPAINSGTIDTTGLISPSTDLAGNPRIIGGRIDMGCYESDVACLKEINVKNINIYPNPLTINSICRFELKKSSEVNIKIYNQNASLIFVKDYGKMPSGVNEVNMSDIVQTLQKNNVYLLNIETQQEIINTKFVY